MSLKGVYVKLCVQRAIRHPGLLCLQHKQYNFIHYIKILLFNPDEILLKLDIVELLPDIKYRHPPLVQ